MMLSLLRAPKILAQIMKSIPIGLAIVRRDGDDLRWEQVSACGRNSLGFDPVGLTLRQTHPVGWEDRIEKFLKVLDFGLPIVREPTSYQDDQTGQSREYLLSLIRLEPHRALMIWIDVTLEARTRTQLEASRTLLQREIETDPLTGCGSRVKLESLTSNNYTPAGVIYLDLNRFKSVNDGLGHRAGDLLLCGVADRLQSRLNDRESLFRPSGDEFAIVLESPRQPSELLDRARSIVAALEEPFWLNRHEVRIAASVGVTDASAGDLGAQLVAADRAMYVAKSHARGRTAIEPWSPGQVEANRYQQRIGLELRRAIRSLEAGLSEFELHYQPIIKLDTGAPIGYEALLRWRSPELGVIPPGIFIPIAEIGGEIYEISRWVMAEAIEQLRRWNCATEIAINLSPWDLERQGLRERMLTLCDRAGVPPSALSLEITERAVTSDLSHFEKVLGELSDSRIRLAIDDFGTGDSGLLRVAQAIDWHEVKVDRSLLPANREDDRRQQICGGIVVLCDRLNIRTLAEGIETEEQATLCRGLGFDHAQGYYFAKPKPASEIGLA